MAWGARDMTAAVFIAKLMEQMREICLMLDRRRKAARYSTVRLQEIVEAQAKLCGAFCVREYQIDLMRTVFRKRNGFRQMHGYVDCVVVLPSKERIFIEIDRSEKSWSRQKLEFCARQPRSVAIWIRWRGRVRRAPSPRICVIDICETHLHLINEGALTRSRGGAWSSGKHRRAAAGVGYFCNVRMRCLRARGFALRPLRRVRCRSPGGEQQTFADEGARQVRPTSGGLF